MMQPTPNFGDMRGELARASSSLSRANMYAVDPYRHLIGALLDAVVAVEDLIADSDPRWPPLGAQPVRHIDGCQEGRTDDQ